MNSDKNASAEERHTKELSREEARNKREYYLALAEKNKKFEHGTLDEIDSADSAMAALVLPGG